MTPGTEDDDPQLLERARRDPAGDDGRAAASELLRRHQRQVYVWCFRYVRDHERAIELAQDVLLSAYRALHTFEGRSQFGSWLYTIARHRCLRAVRAPRLVRDDDVELDALPHPDGNPERMFEDQQGEERLRRLVMEHLDPDERTALWMRCFERLPVEEIGRVLQVEHASGARALLQRARRKLRTALEREGLWSAP